MSAELLNEYDHLQRVVEEYEVPVYDPDMDVFSHKKYGELLKPGSVVWFNRYKHFFCVRFGASPIEGSWIDDEGQCRSTTEFLFYVLSKDEAITLVND